MLRRGGFRSLNTERSKIAISSPTIDDRRRIDTSSHGSVGFPKSNLKSKKEKSKWKKNMNKNNKMEKLEEDDYKSIAFGSSGGLVGNNNSFQDITKLLKVILHGVFLGLPSQATNENLGVSGITKLACYVRWSHDLQHQILRSSKQKFFDFQNKSCLIFKTQQNLSSFCL